MGIFVILLIVLWIFPILAVVASRSAFKKKVLSISLYTAVVIVLGIITGLSTRWDVLDCILIFTLYFSLLMLLLHFYSFKNIVVKVAAGLSVLVSITFGYILGSVGILALGAITQNFDPERTLNMADDYTYKQYSLGMAPESYRGTKISIVKRPLWLPGLEYEVFTKTYDREYSTQFIPADPKKYPTLYSDDFEVKYNSSSKTIILMDSVLKDNISLR